MNVETKTLFLHLAWALSFHHLFQLTSKSVSIAIIIVAIFLTKIFTKFRSKSFSQADLNKYLCNDPDETFCNELSHQELHCLPSCS